MQSGLNHLFRPVRWALLLAPLQAGAIAVDGTVAHHLRAEQPGYAIEQAKDAIIPGSGLPGDTEAEKKKKHDQKVMDAISQFRAEVCFKMKEEHGEEFSSYEACQEFMKKTCHPGRDAAMDGDNKEVTSEKGYCAEYFPQAEKKAEKVVHDEELKEDQAKISGRVAAGPGPSPGPASAAPAPSKAAPAPAAAGQAPGPAPGPMGGPAPGPVPEKFIPGMSAGKPHGTIPDDEAYYYKKDGMHEDRLHMSENRKLPTQGYWGKLVEHEDQKTSIEDWGHEFGPQAGHPSIEAICAHQPDNQWCYEQGFHRHHRSSCPAAAAHIVSFVCALVAIRAF